MHNSNIAHFDFRISIMSENAKEGVCLTNFGEILMQLRQEKHLSQAELGNVIFVSGGTISNYEKGVHYPDVEKLVALAEYFGVSIDYLLGRSRSRLSPDVFDQTLHEETTVGDVVQALQHFSPTRKRAICVMIADMETASMVHIQRKKERN